MIGKRTAARNLDQLCDSAPCHEEHARRATGAHRRLRQRDRIPSRCRSRHRGLSNLFDRPAPDGQRTKQLCFRPGEIEPRQPVRAVDDDHLSIVNGGHVGAGFGRQECEGVAGASDI